MWKNEKVLIYQRLRSMLASISGINRRKLTIKYLMDIEKNYKYNNILDIGSGIKNWSFVFPNAEKYYTVDYRDNVNATFVGDFFKFDFQDTYNLIIATELLEHLPSSELFFVTVNNLLEDDGLLVISFPFLFKIHGDPNDYFRFTLDGIKELSKNNFEIISSEYHGNRLQLIWEIFVDTKFMYPFKILNKLIAKIDYKDKCYPLGYVVILKKKKLEYNIL